MTNKQRTIFREAKHFPIALNHIKYLRVTLTKQVKDCMIKNLKILKRVSENGKRFHGHGSTELT